MSEFDLTEDIEPEEQPDEEEFVGTEPGADSDDTGTHYDGLGEPVATPRDLDAEDDVDEE